MHPLQEILENINEFNQFSIHPYSGRFMYGKECLAISGDGLNIFKIGVQVGEASDFLYFSIDDLEDFRSDDMGLGKVYYWPDIPYTKTE